MEILQSFNIVDGKKNLNVKGSFNEPLFQSNQINELLDSTEISINNEEQDITEQELDPKDITEIELYNIILKSENKGAVKFKKWILNIVKELRINGRYELQNNNIIEKNIKPIVYENRQHIFYEKMHKKRTIYIEQIHEFSNNKFLIKINSCNGMNYRRSFDNIHSTFNSIHSKEIYSNDKSLMLDVFECDKNITFLSFLKNHEDIKCYEYKKILFDEIYCVNIDEYNSIISIIKKHINDYNFSNNLESHSIEITKRDENVVRELNDIQTSFVSRTNTQNRKIQQYDPDTFELIKTHEGLMDVIRTFPNFSKSGIKNAASKNTIYNGFRWFYISPDAEYKHYEIPKTVVNQPTSIPQLIAVINKEKTRIEYVFSTQANASIALKINRRQTINECIKKQSLYKNTYYFRYFNDCEESLRNDYLSRAELPNTNQKKWIKNS